MRKGACIFLATAAIACAPLGMTVSAQRSAKLPISSFVLGVQDNWYQVVNIDPSDQRLGADYYRLSRGDKSLPPRLKEDRTIRVISSTAQAYMDEPLCQRLPTLHVYLGSSRWGRILYDEDFSAHRLRLLRQIRALVDANCARGQIEAIRLAVFQPTTIFAIEDGRYLDRYGRNVEGTHAARYVYYGIVTPSQSANEDYSLVHHDPDGLKRYLRTNQAEESSHARMDNTREAERRLRKEGMAALFKDYCDAKPASCAGLATIVAANVLGQGSGSSSAPPSTQFRSCVDQCMFRAESQRPFCPSQCYEFVAR